MKYVVYGKGNRAYEARNKASVTRVARAWERLGYEPKMYAVDGDPVTCTKLDTHAAAVALGRRGGLAKSDRKTAASRANARKPRPGARRRV